MTSELPQHFPLVKINDWDPGLLASLQSETPDQIQRRNTFGLETINRIDQLERNSENQQEVENLLRGSQTVLANLFDERAPIVTVSIIESLQRAEVSEYVSLRSNGKQPNLEDLFFSLDKKFILDLPLDVYKKILYGHVSNIEGKRAEYEELIKEYRNEYIAGLQKRINSGQIPANEVRVQKKLEETKLEVVDGLCMEEGLNEGQYVPERRVMLISTYSDLDQLRKLYFHEMTHAVAGRTIVRISSPAGDGYSYSRGGVRLYRRSLAEVPDDIIQQHRDIRYDWMDEALTEMIAVAIDRDLDLSSLDIETFISYVDGVYADNIKIVEWVRTRGKNRIGLETFFGAYFEDYSTQDSGMKYTVGLHREIDQAYQTGYLTKLDDAIDEQYIRTTGVEGFTSSQFLKEFEDNPLYFLQRK